MPTYAEKAGKKAEWEPRKGERLIALAGNPNVGKSTLFNALTGLHQHTGNWSGKTVGVAVGHCRHAGRSYLLADLPGTYSLLAHSAEEEAARDFLCFGKSEAAVVVCDATCLERNLNLALQVMEIQPRTVVCVNLLDEALKKGIRVDLARLSENLGVPVVGTTAATGEGLQELLETVEKLCAAPLSPPPPIRYAQPLQEAAAALGPLLEKAGPLPVPAFWAALRFMERDASFERALAEYLGREEDLFLTECRREADALMVRLGIHREWVQDTATACLVLHAEECVLDAVSYTRAETLQRDRKIDRILASRWTGVPVMLLLFLLVFWVTVSGANYPSSWLSQGFARLEGHLIKLLELCRVPPWGVEILIDGVWRVLSWVVAVMLPPMAIFFPFFTLLEDSGYLPRVAFTLDRCFQKAHACGKQALTMCMGLGCNAVGVTGCRIIDSPRERLIAVLTNSLMPCNGRFPTLLSLLSILFAGVGLGSSFLSALLLTGAVALGVGMTFLMSRLLSATILKGVPSSFTLELPPYRRPQFGKVLVRSVLDRTLFVLGRAAAVAAPAGLFLWMMANLQTGGESLLAFCARELDPLGRFLGLDGVLLMAFILSLPANEIFLPVAIMAYLAQGSLAEVPSLEILREILSDNGWTVVTLLCATLFSLFHWPCSTTCLTIHKETGSWKWTAAAVILPTLCGAAFCALIAALSRLTGWAPPL